MAQKVVQSSSPATHGGDSAQHDSAARLEQIATQVLHLAKQQGASDAAVSASFSEGFNVAVRMGKVDTIEHQRDQSIDITVYCGKCKGEVSSSDITPEALQSAVEKAYHIANYMAEDGCYGLPDSEEMAAQFPDLSLNHPWQTSIDAVIDQALHAEAIGRAYDKRITNSEGVEISSQQGVGLYADSRGFMATLPYTHHAFYCALIAKERDEMERDYSYAVVRDRVDMPSIETLATQSAEKTVRRLGARKIASCQVPVIFEAQAARSLLSHFLAAINGYSLYKEASFLLNQLHQRLFPDWVAIYESPYLAKGLASRAFDNEGVVTRENKFVEGGVLQHYLLDSYSARRLKTKTTGNAGGAHNLFITPTAGDLSALIQSMERGVVVTELLGQGVNLVTGDYSRGASGFWVEQGKIAYPLSEITVVGNLKQMYANLVAVGSDIYPYGNIQTGSIWVDKMTIAGK